MKSNYIILTAAILVIFACAQEPATDNHPEMESIDLVFTAGWGTVTPVSKTTLQADGASIWWTPGDKINAFYGSSFAGKFYSSAAEQQPFTSFSGTLNVLTGSVESGAPSSSYWAVYPYNIDNTCDGESVTLRLPIKQNGEEGSFETGLFPAIATSTTLDLVFYNVAGGLRFTVAGEGINSVVIKSNNGTSVSGKVRAGFDENGYPVVTEVLEGADSVVVNAPVGGFIPGEYYFAALLPGTHSEGLNLKLRKDGGYSGVKEVNKAITVNRSLFGKLDSIDDGVQFSLSQYNDNIIDFKDKTLRAKLLAAFDTDGDHELSYAEAAAVTSFDNVFGNIKTYKSFDEFQYFTGITEIPDYMFDGWGSMTSIAIPNSVTKFGNGVFRGCQNLSGTISIPEGMESVPSELFSGCSNLEHIDIPSSVKYFGAAAFKNCQKLTGPITIPSGQVFLYSETFLGCASLTSITIPESVKSIGDSCFQGCACLKSITIPSSVTALGWHCFDWCSQLTSVLIPDSLTDLPAYCFQGCSSLKVITIPDSIVRIGQYCFYGCTGITSLTIPESVTTLEDDCFYGCTGLKSIVIPDSVTSMGTTCFSHCSSLTSATLSKNFPKINSLTFSCCTSLTSVTIPEGITRLEQWVFEQCTSLKNITIPSSVVSINDKCFSRCSQLTSIKMMPATPPSLGNSIFEEAYSVKVYVPSGSVNTYKNHSDWKQYASKIYSQ